jgi:hypothetical protein
MGNAPFDGELFERVLIAANPGDVITTLGIARPNWIVSVDREGVKVETGRSKKGARVRNLCPLGWFRRHGTI